MRKTRHLPRFCSSKDGWRPASRSFISSSTFGKAYCSLHKKPNHKFSIANFTVLTYYITIKQGKFYYLRSTSGEHVNASKNFKASVCITRTFIIIKYFKDCNLCRRWAYFAPVYFSKNSLVLFICVDATSTDI